MLKYRVIRAFVAVWCAVCLSYAGVRTALGTMLNRIDEASEQSEARLVSEQRELVVVTEQSDSTMSIPKEQESVEVEVEDAEPEAPDQIGADGQADDEPLEDAEDAAPIVEREEGLLEEDEWVDEVEDWPEEAETLDIPSLSEYLSWYICGSCRHNCSLANPRCHNGSRLAEIKAQEYYDTYGV